MDFPGLFVLPIRALDPRAFFESELLHRREHATEVSLRVGLFQAAHAFLQEKLSR